MYHVTIIKKLILLFLYILHRSTINKIYNYKSCSTREDLCSENLSINFSFIGWIQISCLNYKNFSIQCFFFIIIIKKKQTYNAQFDCMNFRNNDFIEDPMGLNSLIRREEINLLIQVRYFILIFLFFFSFVINVYIYILYY